MVCVHAAQWLACLPSTWIRASCYMRCIVKQGRARWPARAQAANPFGALVEPHSLHSQPQTAMHANFWTALQPAFHAFLSFRIRCNYCRRQRRQQRRRCLGWRQAKLCRHDEEGEPAAAQGCETTPAALLSALVYLLSCSGLVHCTTRMRLYRQCPWLDVGVEALAAAPASELRACVPL